MCDVSEVGTANTATGLSKVVDEASLINSFLRKWKFKLKTMPISWHTNPTMIKHACMIPLMEEIRLTSWGWQFIPLFTSFWHPRCCRISSINSTSPYCYRRVLIVIGTMEKLRNWRDNYCHRPLLKVKPINQSGPLLVINRVITPTNGLING